MKLGERESLQARSLVDMLTRRTNIFLVHIIKGVDMVQTRDGASNNDWISYMRSCAKAYHEQRRKDAASNRGQTEPTRATTKPMQARQANRLSKQAVSKQRPNHDGNASKQKPTKPKAVAPTSASTPISTTSKAASTKTKSDTKDGAIHASHESDQSTNPKRRLRNKTPARE